MKRKLTPKMLAVLRSLDDGNICRSESRGSWRSGWRIAIFGELRQCTPQIVTLKKLEYVSIGTHFIHGYVAIITDAGREALNETR